MDQGTPQEIVDARLKPFRDQIETLERDVNFKEA